MRVLVLATLVSATATAAAQERPRWPPETWSFGAFLGVHDFADDSGLGREGMPVPGSSLENAVPLGGRVTWWMWDQIGVEGEASLLPTGTVDDRADVLGIGYNAHVIGTVLDPRERFRPYGLFGVGGLAALSDDTGRFGHGAIAQLQMGIAAEMSLERNWGTRVDLRFGLGPDVNGSVGAFDVEFLFGFYAHAGKPPPPPRVVVAEAPPAAATGPIPGPSPVEDVDNDGDQVYGSLDRCPREKETANGYLDDDGCADQLPAGVAEIRGLGTAIFFHGTSARLDWQARQLLNEVARLMKENGQLRVAVVGHTDTRGDRARNVTISQRRADAVHAYLLKQGIPETRLEAIGKGPDEPVADSATAEGRAKNQRIELIVSW